MKFNRFLFVAILFACIGLSANAQVKRIDPAYWWTGMKSSKLQLLVYGDSIAKYSPKISYKGVELKKVNKFANPNYLALDLEIGKNAKPGTFAINFTDGSKKGFTTSYELKQRAANSADRKGFTTEDVIYLLMPDRFANGDTSNDNIPGMEQMDRSGKYTRHGGDIQGIANNLDYIKNLGVTAMWLNPVQENNQEKESYHGYTITDLYKIDPRLGTNDLYFDFVKKSHDKGLKVIMDMVFNHVGSNTYFIKDLPASDWLNWNDTRERSNFRGETISDPNASEADKAKMSKGWFDEHMADLDQTNPFVYRYLLQNAIWWVEASGLDGIRIDTYPYPNKEAMASLVGEIMNEYPNFNIVGECWLKTVPATAYWQKGTINNDGYASTLPSITDFAIYDNLAAAFNEPTSWTGGLARLYTVLSQDMAYANPSNLVIFPDNHDVSRLFTNVGNDVNKWKQALAFVLTTRGIPQIYYGTEYLDHNNEGGEHAYIRKDLPGGWQGDSVSVITGQNLTDAQRDAMKYISTLLNWRKTSEPVTKGRLVQFIPDGDTYTYFRVHGDKAVMVVLNNGEARPLETARFKEILSKYKGGKDVATGKDYSFANGKIELLPHNAIVLDLY